MIFTRRDLLAGGSIASVAIATSTRAIESRSNQITIFDSRDARSRTFAAAGPEQNIDVAQKSVNLWSVLRKVPRETFVSGFTRWSDFIAIRGQLESAGLRVKYLKPQGDFIDWAME